MTDLHPDPNTVVDAPLQESEMPLMGNPVLTGTTRRRPARAGPNLGWYVGLPVAVLALGAAAYAVVSHMSQPAPLTTGAPAAPPPAAVAAAAPAQPVQPVAPAPVVPQEAAAAPERPVHPARTRVLARNERQPAHRARAATRSARAAGENSADVSATAPETTQGQIAAPPPVVAKPVTPPPPPVIAVPPASPPASPSS